MPHVLSRAKLARAARRLNAGALVLMTDDLRLPDPLPVARALPRGSLVIIRARDAKRRAELARLLKPIGFRRDLILLVADDPALARAVGAAGLHLPEKRARQAGHWRAKNPGWFITASAHSLRALLSAPHADALLLSPVFATASHKDARSLSPARGRLMARDVPAPVFALGGVTAQNAGLLHGFAGIAAIGALNPEHRQEKCEAVFRAAPEAPIKNGRVRARAMRPEIKS